MTLSFVAAAISAFFLSLMLIFDRLMMGDCYKNKPDVAWAVSSIAGSVFGIGATCIAWILYSAVVGIPLSSIFSNTSDLFFPYGLLLILAGALSIQMLRPYFKLFIPANPNDEVDETFVALWLAASPIFIFLTTSILYLFFPDIVQLTGLDKASNSLWFGLTVCAAVVSLIGFEQSNANVSFDFKKYRVVASMMFYIVLYTLLVSAILRLDAITFFDVLCLQIFFWTGFLAGSRVLLRAKVRQQFTETAMHINVFFLPIVVVESIGMLVYYFEFFSLSDLDPTLVNLIIGTHVIFVFIFSLFLSKLKTKLQKKGQDTVKIATVTISTETLPTDSFTYTKLAWFVAAVIFLSLAITLH